MTGRRFIHFDDLAASEQITERWSPADVLLLIIASPAVLLLMLGNLARRLV